MLSVDDPLLSVSQIAREWGTGLDVVITLVNSQTLPSLDRGELVRQGHLDIPLIRESWAEFMRSGSEDVGRILEPPEDDEVHPAANTALAVHSALDMGDAQELWNLSSSRSRAGHSPESLLARWTALNQGSFPPDSGVGSTVYSLAPVPAVGARIFANAPKIPRVVTRPTPATLIAVLPFVWEDGDWKVDLPLYAGDDGDLFLPEILTKPVPEGAILDPSQPDDGAPPQSHPPKA